MDDIGELRRIPGEYKIETPRNNGSKYTALLLLRMDSKHIDVVSD